MISVNSTPLVALAGKPNTGKTALFNRLTGSRAKVGNYAGVTVERREGPLRLPNRGDAARLLDIPGTPSLSARSVDEQIAIRALAGLGGEPSPDLALLVLDGTQLENNLYLALQVIELDLPTVVAVNMADVLEKQETTLDLARLEADLGVPVVAVSAIQGTGIESLRRRIQEVLEDPDRGRPGWRWTPTDPELLAEIDAVGKALPQDWNLPGPAEAAPGRRRRALALWSLLSVESEDDELIGVSPDLRRAVEMARSSAEERGLELDEAIIRGRYEWIEERMPRYLHRAGEAHASLSDRIDAVLLSPWIGFPLFLGAMAVLFQSLFAWADPAIGAIEALMGWISKLLRPILPDGWIEGLIVDGVVAGVGGVLVFLPQILLLFLFLGLMQDTGYMARVAYLMDRVMKSVGLHGRAFVPMMSGYACAIPAVMATRTMERERDRLLTMLVVPLMTCSARLPVYTLLIAAMYPPGNGGWLAQGGLMVSMYLFSTLMALAVAAVFGRTILKGPRIPLLLELPPYRVPRWKDVFREVGHHGMQFVRGAGGVILVCTVALWFLLSFPGTPEDADREAGRAALEQQLEAAPAETSGAIEVQLADLEAAATAEQLRESYAGRLGRAVEPAIAPLGFDWQIGIGLIGAFAAREVFVSTMAVVYGLEDSATEESPRLRERIAAQTWPDGRRVFTFATCLSLMVFFALACQCMSTVAAVKRETNGWRWPVFLFTYTLVLAWGMSFLTYQGARLLGLA